VKRRERVEYGAKSGDSCLVIMRKRKGTV